MGTSIQDSAGFLLVDGRPSSPSGSHAWRQPCPDYALYVSLRQTTSHLRQSKRAPPGYPFWPNRQRQLLPLWEEQAAALGETAPSPKRRGRYLNLCWWKFNEHVNLTCCPNCKLNVNSSGRCFRRWQILLFFLQMTALWQNKTFCDIINKRLLQSMDPRMLCHLLINRGILKALRAPQKDQSYLCSVIIMCAIFPC